MNMKQIMDEIKQQAIVEFKDYKWMWETLEEKIKNNAK